MKDKYTIHLKSGMKIPVIRKIAYMLVEEMDSGSNGIRRIKDKDGNIVLVIDLGEIAAIS